MLRAAGPASRSEGRSGLLPAQTAARACFPLRRPLGPGRGEPEEPQPHFPERPPPLGLGTNLGVEVHEMQ